jgi:3-isopropylmalate dehydrogenase
MALRYSFDLKRWADLLDEAIAAALARNLRTGDIMQPGMKRVGTREMGEAIREELVRRAA